MAAKVEGLLWERADRAIDAAREDAKACGGGWLLVDAEGRLKHVPSSGVIDWAIKQVQRRVGK